MPKDSPAVALWRDFAHLNLSASWKIDVDKTITDIELWRKILAGWHYFDAKGKKHNKHPGIKNLLSEYERRQFDAIQQQGDLPERSREGIPTGSECSLPALRCSASGWKG